MKPTAYVGLVASAARYAADTLTRRAAHEGRTTRYRAMPSTGGWCVVEYEPDDEQEAA